MAGRKRTGSISTPTVNEEEVKEIETTEEEEQVKEREELTKEENDFHSLAYKIRKEAFKKKKCIIVSNDTRDNSSVNTAQLHCENSFFSIGRIVPLGMEVEIEQCLIDVARDAIIIHFTPEMVKGETTGNMVAVDAKRYSVSYVD